MASSSDADAATEALIAQLMAEDLGESYSRHSAPIGSSYHDYEEPLSSYERQCLDAENNPDEEGEKRSGWGPEDPGEINCAAAPDEGLYSTWPADEGTWDSRFVNEEGIQQMAATTQQSEISPGANENNENEDDCDPDSSDQERLGSPARITSRPPYNVPPNPVDETSNISAPSVLSTETRPYLWPGPVLVAYDHFDDAPPPWTSPVSKSLPPAIDACGEPPASQPASTGREVESQWDDGLDYSSSKGKGKAVRAYDEFKRGRRDDRGDGWTVVGSDYEDKADVENEDHDTEEGDIDDEDLPFIRIPWPSTENDDLLSRREDAEVVEIHVGDDETLESILRDISLRNERRQKGKGVEGTVECVGEEVREREMVLGRKHVAAWW
ncbi:MAG: hypothetical protein Q9175_002876 [Cornicularia normoerica]